MRALKVSYSGVRGIVGEALTADVARHFAYCFGLFLTRRFKDPLILLGRDTRPSGPMLREAVVEGLSQIPCSVLELGVLPSPTLQFGLAHWNASGGIMITASHNPHEWNGFKFLAGPDNTVLDAEETQELFRLYQETPFPGGKENLIGEFRHLEGKTSQAHVRRVLELIDKDLIRSRRFSVAMDPGQGAGEESCRLLLEELGCSVVEVASNRESEPTPENLWELCESVRTRKCDLGVAQDLDADRLALVSEEGEAIGEEYTLCFAVGHLLRRNHGRHPMVVVNSSTTHVIAELARLYGADLVETRVGEVNLSRALKIYSNLGRTTFGGEGNGGVIYPPVIYGRDSLIALGLILEEMAQTGKSIRALRDELPRMFLYKAKFPRAEDKALEPVFDDLQSRFPAADVSFMDGLKMSWPDGSWLQIRPSNTEPIVRVMVESKDNRWAADTFALLKGML